jgi:glutamate-1-semialdehyde aminotransferase
MAAKGEIVSDILPRASTFSKGPEFWGQDFQPATVQGGRGAQLIAEHGRSWLDWVSALGANLLGYGHTGFATRVAAHICDGTGYSLPSYLEQQVAERLVAMLGENVPGWQAQPLSVRFGLSGSDACSMAVRLARAVTGRERIVSVGYHGWGAEFIAATPPAWGVPRHPVTAVPFGAYEALVGAMEGANVACVIIEQPPQAAPPNYWRVINSIRHDYGALLILDEVVTGLRFGLGGAAEVLNIHPDIVCMGKALGNGVPVSAMVFRREWASWFARSDPVFVSSTHFGCTMGLAAADYVLGHWTDADVAHLYQIGAALKVGLQNIGYTVNGHPVVTLVKHESPAHHAYFVAAMRDRGILINRPNIPCLAHRMTDVDRTVAAAREVWAEMQSVDVATVMASRLPEVLFANR